MQRLRIDDIGASSKRWERYSRIPGGNFLFLKRIWPFRAWGPYRELTATEISDMARAVELRCPSAAPVVLAVTACWVEYDGHMTPYYERFPKQADAIRRGVKDNLFVIANHGLTHCRDGRHLPRWFGSNRAAHREFGVWLNRREQSYRIAVAQDILEESFGVRPSLFVPPGYVFTGDTEYVCRREGLEMLYDEPFAYHDRDVLRYGMDWFVDQLWEVSRWNDDRNC